MDRLVQQANPVPPRQLRIVIADDFETLRRGLKSLLGAAICGEAENGQEAVEKVLELRPDIIMLDLTMPVMNGLQAARMIRSFAPETKIIVFSLHDENAVREEALRAGADVFLHKTATGEDILKAIAVVMSGVPERSRVGVGLPLNANENGLKKKTEKRERRDELRGSRTCLN